MLIAKKGRQRFGYLTSEATGVIEPSNTGMDHSITIVHQLLSFRRKSLFDPGEGRGERFV